MAEGPPPADPEAPSPGAARPAGLARRFALGMLSVGVGSWTLNALSIAINLALARILGPEVLGFYAFVFAINEALNSIGAFSMGLALVQCPEESEALYDTAFVISVALGAIGLLAAAVVAPFLVAYHSAQAGWFIVALGAGRILMLLTQVPMARLERGLRFGTVSIVNFVSGAVPRLLALGGALLGMGAAALLARDLLAHALMLAMALFATRRVFGGRVERGAASRLMSFARPMFLSRTLEIGLQRIDRILVGVFFGDTRLGFYNQARFLAETGQIVGAPLMQLTFNLYSRLQGEPERLARSSDMVNFFLVRVVFAGLATLLVFPDETVRLLLGAEWVESAPLLWWLAVYAGLLPVFDNMKQLLYGRGAVAANVWLRVAQLVLFVPGILAGAWLGSVAVVAATLTGITVLGVGVAAYLNRDLRGEGLLALFGRPALALAATWLGLAALARAGLLAPVPWFALPFLPPLAYALAILLLDRSRLLAEARFVREALRERRGT
jgi:PST family polysaccharide transporter